MAGLGAAQLPAGKRRVSAGFLVDMLAATFLGPASAFGTSVIGELSSTRVHPTRSRALLINLFANGLPALVAGTVIRAWAPADHKSIGFYLLLCGVTIGCFVLGFLILSPLIWLLDGHWVDLNLQFARQLLPTMMINVLLAVAGAAIYVELGLAGIIFAFVALFAFSYKRVSSRGPSTARSSTSRSPGACSPA